MSTDTQLPELVAAALRRAYALGQTYWQQADSDSYAQMLRAEATSKKFEDLVAETRAALAPTSGPVQEDQQKHDPWAVLGRFFKFWAGSTLYDYSGAEIDVEEPYEAFRAIHAQHAAPASPAPDRAEALRQALGALQYHQEQTRPIARTQEAIDVLVKLLGGE